MEEDYRFFKSAILQKTGLDLSLYKERQMKRRLESLYKRHHFHSFRHFFQEGLVKDPILLQAFLQKMTINVSGFYRDKDRWDYLESVILNELLQTDKQLTIWSAACSSGEEAYTVAMIASQYVSLSRFSIIATDIDAEALKRARIGFYKEASLEEMHVSEISRAFDQSKDGYHVKPRFKQTIRFQRHNLLADPYPRFNDLIICRNALIYFNSEAKERIYHGFNRSLNSGGFLFVGNTEQIFSPEKYGFEQVSNFFYRKQNSLRSLP